MSELGPGGGGVNSKGVPECTAKHYPAAGGYEAGSVESDGETGEKSVGEMSAPTGDTENGNFDSAGSAYPPSGTHGAEDPACGGPPLGYTSESDPNRSMY